MCTGPPEQVLCLGGIRWDLLEVLLGQQGLDDVLALAPAHLVPSCSRRARTSVGRRWTSCRNGSAASCHRCALTITGSVSYTHLRAHETRHDLVCRLLLDKKKPT